MIYVGTQWHIREFSYIRKYKWHIRKPSDILVNLTACWRAQWYMWRTYHRRPINTSRNRNKILQMRNEILKKAMIHLENQCDTWGTQMRTKLSAKNQRRCITTSWRTLTMLKNQNQRKLGFHVVFIESFTEFGFGPIRDAQCSTLRPSREGGYRRP